ncbi:MAG: hypothetical protein GWP09_02760 [Nitrospiraceae bacterium]|nr:hypothetical protein [Nitrospiraceae bacterium]
MFPNKKLNYKRLVAENLNKKAITGFWCKGINAGNLFIIAGTKGCMAISYMHSHYERSLAPVTISYFSLRKQRKRDCHTCRGGMFAMTCYN